MSYLESIFIEIRLWSAFQTKIKSHFSGDRIGPDPQADITRKILTLFMFVH